MRLNQFLVLLLLAAIWGASFIFMRIAAPEFGPIPLIGLRVGIAGLILFAFTAMRGNLKELRGNEKFFLITGITTAAIPFSLFAYATTLLSGGFTSILNSLAPLFTALVGYFWLRNYLTGPAVFGLLLGLAGVVLLSLDSTNLVGGKQWYGVVAGISATMFYGFAAHYAKEYSKGISTITITTGSSIGATLAILPFVIYFWPQVNPSVTAWCAAILLAVFCTALAHLMYFWLLEQVSAHSVVSVTFMIPVFGMLWGYLFLDESVTTYMLLGCGVILLGVALTIGLIGGKTE